MVCLLSPWLWEAVEVPVALGTGSASEGPGPPSQPDGALQLGASWRVSHTSGSAWLGPCVPWSTVSTGVSSTPVPGASRTGLLL